MERILKEKNVNFSFHEDTKCYLMKLIVGNFSEIMEDIRDVRNHRRGSSISNNDLEVVLNKIWKLKVETNSTNLVKDLSIKNKKRKLSIISKKRTKKYFKQHVSNPDISIGLIEDGYSEVPKKEWIEEVDKLVTHTLEEHVRIEDYNEIESILHEGYIKLLTRYIHGMYKNSYYSTGLYEYLSLTEVEPVNTILLPSNLLSYMCNDKIHVTRTWCDVLNRIRFKL